MIEPPTFTVMASHIRVGDHIFQVLNADQSDWDEAATAAAMKQYAATIPAVNVTTPIGNVSVTVSK